jgi:hypothetical protein
VILQAWGSAAVLVLASVMIGQAMSLLGLRCRAAGPAVGLATLIVVAAIAIKLPGRAVTAALVLLVVVLLAAVVVVRGRGASRPPLATLPTVLMAGFGAAIPYLANGRVGLPGVSLDNDTANHLLWAEALRSPVAGARYGLPAGYPLGPHSLIDALASGLGARLDLALTGLLIATVVITALVAAGSMPGDSAWKKPIVGVLAALLYLPAAYYAEGAFKETLLGLLLLAVVLHLEGLRSDWDVDLRGRVQRLLPLAVLTAGAIYIYSYVALAWLGLTWAFWIAAEVVTHPEWRHGLRARVRGVAVPTGVAVLALLVLLLPSAGRIASFVGTIGISPSGTGAIATSNLGNLAHSLSAYEAFGIWNSPDFRFFPVGLFHAGELSALAIGVVGFGLLWAVRRREFVLPAAVLACAIIYWRAFHGQSPYVAAKALVIAGPVVAVAAGRGLLRTPEVRLSRWVGAGRFVAAAAFLILAAHSSYIALRDEPVWTSDSTNELLALDRFTRGESLLFLGNSDYAPWIFHDSNMSALGIDTVSMSQALPAPTKPNTYGTALDFDSVSASTVNRFSWVITTNTSYASQPPSGFLLVRRLRMYELWRRVAPVSPRSVLEPAGAPGAILNCRVPAQRRLSHKRGVAAVMTAPAIASLSGILPGGSDTTSVRVPAGEWEISLQYTSPEPLDIAAGGRRFTMPAYVDRPGPFFAVGSVTSTGAPISVIVHERRPSFLTGPGLAALLTDVAAVASPDPRTLVPMRRACGRYVDWYRLAG